MINRILVKDLKDKENIISVYLVKEKNIGVGKNGKPFMTLTLGDSTGNIEARVWDNVEDNSKEFENGDIVTVKGNIQIYQNRKQVIISKISRVDSSEYNLDDFVMKSNFNPEEMFAELILLVKEIKSDFIKRLILSTLEDPEIKTLFLRAPAAKSIHHAWFGGLLEHVLSITKILKSISENYQFLNRDLLYFGAIFHDIGKLWELEYETSIGYTDRGRLVGHMEIGCELVDKKSSQILGFPQDLRDICKHMILSHHGKLEYGSSKRPKFLEAFLVAAVDELDSKVNTIYKFIENERSSGEKWSRYNESFERYFLLENLKDKYD